MSSIELDPPVNQPNLLPYVFAAISVHLSEEEADVLAELMHLDPEDRDADISVTDLGVVPGTVPDDLLRRLRELFDPKSNGNVIVIDDVLVIPLNTARDDSIVVDCQRAGKTGQ